MHNDKVFHFYSCPTKGALVNIQITGRPCVAWGAGANCLAVDWVGVTVGAFLTGVADAGIIEVT